MMRVYADSYIELGRRLQGAGSAFERDEYLEKGTKHLNDKGKAYLKDELKNLLAFCKTLPLPISTKLIEGHVEDVPQTEREYQVLVSAVTTELHRQLFLFVPPRPATYYELAVPEPVKWSFPGAWMELATAGTSLAAGLYAASIFHSRRAAEIGVAAMTRALEITLPCDVALAEFGQIVSAVGVRLNELRLPPPTPKKAADLKFYGDALVQFRYLANAWRVRTAHAGEFYDEGQAVTALDHTLGFFAILATRLKQ